MTSLPRIRQVCIWLHNRHKISSRISTQTTSSLHSARIQAENATDQNHRGKINKFWVQIRQKNQMKRSCCIALALNVLLSQIAQHGGYTVSDKRFRCFRRTNGQENTRTNLAWSFETNKQQIILISQKRRHNQRGKTPAPINRNRKRASFEIFENVSKDSTGLHLFLNFCLVHD